MIKEVIKFFDKLEDKVRGRLSHYPIIYAFVGGIGAVLFWRGVWYIADSINTSGIISIIIGSIILLSTGVLVYAFIGNRLIISGLTGEKKLTEKIKGEIEIEEAQFKNLQNTLNRIEKKLSELEKEQKI